MVRTRRVGLQEFILPELCASFSIFCYKSQQDIIYNELKNKGKIIIDNRKYEQLLKEALKCELKRAKYHHGQGLAKFTGAIFSKCLLFYVGHKCGEVQRNMPDLKSHIASHFE